MKGAAFCHVDGIDGIFTRDEARQVAEAVVAAGGREVFCLAWEFQMELRQHCLALKAEHGIRMKRVPIPREIMEKNRKSPPPFLKMAVLEAEAVTRTEGGNKIMEVKLTKFLPSLAEVPSKELEALQERAIRSDFDFIDFWAVDFDWKPGQPFHHDWQNYRTRKDRSLKTVSDSSHVYAGARQAHDLHQSRECLRLRHQRDAGGEGMKATSTDQKPIPPPSARYHGQSAGAAAVRDPDPCGPELSCPEHPRDGIEHANRADELLQNQVFQAVGKPPWA